MSHGARAPLIAGVLAALALGVYLLAARQGGFVGFPLDDAWIHQTYARNLAQLSQWAFVPGQPTAGSTSVLWTLLLALGYVLGLDFLPWTALCGWAALAATAGLAGRLARRLGAGRPAALAAASIVALEWHLVWAAASGMETVLFCALALLTFNLLPMAGEARPVRAWLWAGLAAGAALLTRPDGLTLLPFAGVALLPLWGRQGVRAGLRQTLALGLGAGLCLAAYLAFNFLLNGQAWPNTFYAKQAEYAVLREAPLWARLWTVGRQPFVGPLSLLAPGMVLSVGLGLAQRVAAPTKPEPAGARPMEEAWLRLLPLGWALAFLGLYAWRLPVDYQHGRYVMPVIPVWVAYGVEGLARWAGRSAPGMLRRVLGRAWALSVGALCMAFVALGAQAYTRDVAFIQTEMVAGARWLEANTPAQALIAAHDIGAVGYVARRPILDLAGLISPEVIPILRDEAALAEHIVAAGADYVLTFPGWYPALTADPRFVRVYTTGGAHSQAPAGENMAVYRVAPD